MRRTKEAVDRAKHFAKRASPIEVHEVLENTEFPPLWVRTKSLGRAPAYLVYGRTAEYYADLGAFRAPRRAELYGESKFIMQGNNHRSLFPRPIAFKLHVAPFATCFLESNALQEANNFSVENWQLAHKATSTSKGAIIGVSVTTGSSASSK